MPRLELEPCTASGRKYLTTVCVHNLDLVSLAAWCRKVATGAKQEQSLERKG